MSIEKNTTETLTIGRLTIASPAGRSAELLCFCKSSDANPGFAQAR
ncbi:Mycobacterium rhizamassiliense ORFan [Mycobacterium rhizamassiliense]|jgi:hypothetical protein|uniref:Mycobacterium rhizamassiliense ORFan n=1 Tax=Mycobacterium rhizamassiliense TaxID=1841860 RepID=A0A2U3NYB5_9MYCO|nr:hypothetical protein [Mycobacterium rhizamassiliense]SPM36501.1 Mycobacterium rhizamassiliense ORFan [Mycobacterium rhizamassiliense]